MRAISGRFVAATFLIGVILSTAFSFVGYAVLDRVTLLHDAHHGQQSEVDALLGQLQRTGSLETAQQRFEAANDLRQLRAEADWCASDTTIAYLSAVFRIGPGPCDDYARLLEDASGHLVAASFDPALHPFAFGAVVNRLYDYSDLSVASLTWIQDIHHAASVAVRAVALAVSGILVFAGLLGVRMRTATLARLRASENRFSASQARFRAAIDSAREGMGVLDENGCIIEANPSLKKLLNAREGTVLHKIPIIADGLRAHLGGDTTPTPGDTNRFMEIDLSLDDGRILRLSITPIPGGGAVAIAADLTELHKTTNELKALSGRLRQAQAAAERQALLDPLTQLPNRRAFDQMLDRVGSTNCVLVRMDLDRFKYVNDTFGHAAGDAVLVHIARILEEETAGHRLAARVGGDEFVVLLDAGATEADAQTVVERTSARIRNGLTWQGRLLPCGASFGIASAANLDDGCSPQDVLAAADVALYRAKEAGRNTSALYSPDVHRQVVAQRRLADAMIEALETQAFEPYYQPQIDARTGAFSGVEVLARWPRPDGIVPPDVFLPLAEQMRCVPDVDACIFSKVEQHFTRWQDQGIRVPKIAFNVSAHRLRDSDFVVGTQRFATLGTQVSVELLESVLLEELDGSLDWQLDQLRAAGARIEVDDFGSGHASVMGLYRVRPDCLKIDRRIVAAADGADASAGLVLKAVIEIGKAMNAEIIAEGVETDAMAERLRKLGVDTLQGYLIARPMGFADLPAWIEKRALQRVARAIGQ